MKLLTVIVPTYNMQQLLPHCLDSLLAVAEPLRSKLEVLVVNDGSTDGTLSVARRYEADYPGTVRVIDKSNGHYGSCVNAALPGACGRYVRLLDADDCVSVTGFQTYLSALSGVDADVVVTDFDMVRDGKVVEHHAYPSLPRHRVVQLDRVEDRLERHPLWMHSVTFRTGHLRAIGYRQSEGIAYTDQEWIFLPVASAKTLVYVPGVVYQYHIGNEAQSTSYTSYALHMDEEMQGMRHMARQLQGLLSDDRYSLQYMLHRVAFRLEWVFFAYIVLIPQLRNRTAELIELDAFLRKHCCLVYQLTMDVTHSRLLPLRFVYWWRIAQDLPLPGKGSVCAIQRRMAPWVMRLFVWYYDRRLGKR